MFLINYKKLNVILFYFITKIGFAGKVDKYEFNQLYSIIILMEIKEESLPKHLL